MLVPSERTSEGIFTNKGSSSMYKELSRAKDREIEELKRLIGEYVTVLAT